MAGQQRRYAALLIDAPRLINDSKGAVVSSGGDVTLTVSNLLSNMTGIIDAGSRLVTLSGASEGSGGLVYTGSTLDNNGGTLLASGGTTRLELGNGAVSNVGGTIQGQVTAGSLDTSSDGSKAGMVSSLVDSLTLSVDSLTSDAGKLFARTALVSTGTTLSNTNGSQLSGDSVNLTAANQHHAHVARRFAGQHRGAIECLGQPLNNTGTSALRGAERRHQHLRFCRQHHQPERPYRRRQHRFCAQSRCAGQPRWQNRARQHRPADPGFQPGHRRGRQHHCAGQR